MKRVKSETDKRLIVEVKISGKSAYMLIDTGASAGMIDVNQADDFDVVVGNKYCGSIVGAGGEMQDVRYTHTMAEFEGNKIPQFLLADIGNIVRSIKRETGIKILGIISLKQMQVIGLNIDTSRFEVWVE
jgi:hypothetical protein